MKKRINVNNVERIDFELFKSNVCHELKGKGDVEFLSELLEKDLIREYYLKKWYPECLYLLAMLDYISRLNDIPICTRYDDLRSMKLKEIIYPASLLAQFLVLKDEDIKLQAVKESISEFIRFNIVEKDVRNVI